MRIAAMILAGALAVSAAPAFAADVSGLYAGMYGGRAMASESGFDLDLIQAFANSDTSSFPAPTSFVNGGIDPSLFAILNQELALVPFPIESEGGGAVASGTISYDPSAIFGGVVGYRFVNGFRLEADVSSTSLAANTVTLADTFSSGAGGEIDPITGVWTWTSLGGASLGSLPATPFADLTGLNLTTTAQFLLVNGWYDIPTGTIFNPYLGGGLGIARLESRLYSPPSTCGCAAVDIRASGIVPAAQLGGGLRIQLAAPVTLDLGYRYRMAFNPGLHTDVVSASPLGPGTTSVNGLFTNQRGIIGVHTLTAGLTFALN